MMSIKRFDELREEHFAAHPGSRERVAEKEAQLREELNLGELRHRRGRTQTEIATSLGGTQAGISRLEAQADAKVSTLRAYVAATGGRLRLLAEYPDGDYELAIASDSAHSPDREFAVIWQDPETRRLVHIGRLVAGEQGRCTFAYTADAELNPRFEPFPELPELRESYEFEQLPAVFAERVVAPTHQNYDRLLDALGFTRDEATPVELLTHSAGTVGANETLQIVPEPYVRSDGVEVRRFLVSGCRHADANSAVVEERIARLRPESELHLVDEPENPKNSRAIRLHDADDQPVGWVPDYLVDYLHKARNEGTVRLLVEQANGSDVPWHLRILTRVEHRRQRFST